MKFYLLILSSIILISCATQKPISITKGMHFRDLEGTIWLNSNQVNDSSIFGTYEINLGLLRLPADSIKTNLMMWLFKDSILNIQSHNAAAKKDSLMLSCSYSLDTSGRELHLKLANGRRLAYNYVSTSTGTYVLLSRKSGKR